MAHDRSAIRPQALFLDLDGTLLDESRLQEAIVRTCERVAAVQPGLLASQLAEANAREWAAYWAEIEDAWTLGTLDGASVQLETWRRTLRACGCNDDSAARLAAQTFGDLCRESYALFNDVPELLKSAKRAGVKLALVTNGASDTQREKLCALAIEHWFDAVVISGEVGVAKPDPAAFEIALSRLAVPREGVWHVGDSLTADVVGAKAAGLTAVWLNRRGRIRTDDDPEPDRDIRSMSDLVTLLTE